ncbi:sigma factor G inhibitor Gin [Bacillus aquiflavi]|uniref:Sigma factor G inhibitor Gin n=1 Tax=Bacillus aquiflavi TaxID=2672567 RepID=A0A6B3W2G4_9BACI|nr:sigma factor G inhibitor Gin [Bacillus aquiflavi]MBA4537469.1 sigma factor G inhibitor Gin [Bacillus aquiflavi]NEY81724.1 sigma factor G inhibitor Gin [Bacillus aquiflavi]UAC48207.1 sigma factor G inhibitor Gin [Bacillus aquiflavi]
MSSGLSEKNEETCIICNQVKTIGIHLYTSFICIECENDLIKTTTSDPKYKYYLNKLKKINTPQIFS